LNLLQRFIADQKALWQMVWALKLPLLLLAVCWALAARYLGWNISPSMHEKLVYIERGVQPKNGDLVVYTFAGEGLPEQRLGGARFFKRVRGQAGAVITVGRGNEVFVDQVSIGFAKHATRLGVVLEPLIPAGTSLTVPPGYLFVAGDTPDSFDSRYARSGLVRATAVIGIAHALF
jgi:conjugal transfer pilin signal peptidase TrbI